MNYEYTNGTLREHSRAESRKVLIVVCALTWLILGCLIGQAWVKAQDRQRERVEPPDAAFMFIQEKGKMTCIPMEILEAK